MNNKRQGRTFEEFKKIALASPAARDAYDREEEEWQLRELLLSARENANLSQTELAKRLEVAPSNIHRIENSPLNTNMKTILKYLNACNVKFEIRLSA